MVEVNGSQFNGREKNVNHFLENNGKISENYEKKFKNRVKCSKIAKKCNILSQKQSTF